MSSTLSRTDPDAELRWRLFTYNLKFTYNDILHNANIYVTFEIPAETGWRSRRPNIARLVGENFLRSRGPWSLRQRMASSSKKHSKIYTFFSNFFSWILVPTCRRSERVFKNLGRPCAIAKTWVAKARLFRSFRESHLFLFMSFKFKNTLF